MIGRLVVVVDFSALSTDANLKGVTVLVWLVGGSRGPRSPTPSPAVAFSR